MNTVFMDAMMRMRHLCDVIRSNNDKAYLTGVPDKWDASTLRHSRAIERINGGVFAF